MTARERIQAIRVIELVEKQPLFARQIGVSGYMNTLHKKGEKGGKREYEKDICRSGDATYS